MLNSLGRERVLIQHLGTNVRIDTEPVVVVNGVIEQPYMRESGRMRRLGELMIELAGKRRIIGIEMSGIADRDLHTIYAELEKRTESVSGRPYSRVMAKTLKEVKGAFFGHGDN